MVEDESEITRIRIVIRGAVQGVGFRPFVYRLASELKLKGWISNTSQGVFIEAEGVEKLLKNFLIRLEKEKPPRSFIQSLEYSFLDPLWFSSFEIKQSSDGGKKSVLVLPDIAICAECLRELFDSSNRRYRYPFINCTNCGPRYSIIESLPYDRKNTTMKSFAMCDKCSEEYHNPLDRRFHAQPNACPQCGPQLTLWDSNGDTLTQKDDALMRAIAEIQQGKIAAVKGIGGFHLAVDARNPDAVHRLRQRKHREEKPFAVMYPNVETLQNDCEISELEKRLLLSPESPIVLLNRKKETIICNDVAPNNPYIGAMLPYSPLHHLLLNELKFPIVATSGNLSEEPICIDEREALNRLKDITDVFLVHNRPILRHIDDSIVRVIMERELVIRRARGYAPLPIPTKESLSPMISVGAHLKNTIAITADTNIVPSQHIGDLSTSEAFDAFKSVQKSLVSLYDVNPKTVICDLHPDYLSTQFAKQSDIALEQVQHHYAHICACMAENELDGRVLGISWDGTGYGTDGTIWGGEFILTTDSGFERFATFRPFRLPGGEKAIIEPRRSALGVLYEIFKEGLFTRENIPILDKFSKEELVLIQKMLSNKLNSPLTTSAGRIFDAVSSLLGIRHYNNFEGQAAMELEFSAYREITDEILPFEIDSDKKPITINWEKTIRAILDDIKDKVSIELISTKFHNTLSEIIIAVARQVNENRVVLSGGCFQNRYLTERTIKHLREEGFHPYWHQRIPPNDGGISVGQIFAAAKTRRNSIL